MKEFLVCYILDNDIKREKMIKEFDALKAEVVHELLEKINTNRFFLSKGEQGDFLVNSSLVRYIRVTEK
ncbi:hypothetical protein [Robertmurraya sp. FSL R5-0851]|uniref:hypothetical protein n=1 Tax=Robertmurraya sp. FSL R5-0851 TaxID=2921584 RepID=UPI0030F50F8F